MPNPVVHFEFAVSDFEKGKSFYGDLFGWEIKDSPEMPYGLISTGDGPGGGIYAAMKHMKPFITFYVNVDDIDASLKKAEDLGGKILVEKKKISDEHGYMGMFADLDGNAVGLWCQS
ncbi:MAG TPA: VOC family protein [bacterium]|jgi:hypothetical protein